MRSPMKARLGGTQRRIVCETVCSPSVTSYLECGDIPKRVNGGDPFSEWQKRRDISLQIVIRKETLEQHLLRMNGIPRLIEDRIIQWR